MESDLSESDRLRKLQEETLSKLRLECSNVETKNIEKERYPRIRPSESGQVSGARRTDGRTSSSSRSSAEPLKG